MTTEVQPRKPAPLWTLLATLAGSATLTGWLAAIPGGNHDSLSHPNATSMGIEEDELLYVVPPLPDAVDATLGSVGLVLLIAAIIRLTQLIRVKSLGVDSAVAAGLLVVAGTILGLTWMCVTYGTVDANIGGGLAFFFGVPFAGLFFIPALVIYLAQLPK